MVKIRQFGTYNLQAIVMAVERGYQASIVVSRSDSSDRKSLNEGTVIFVQQFVGNAFVFEQARAAIQHAFDVGHRHIRSLTPNAAATVRQA